MDYTLLEMSWESVTGLLALCFTFVAFFFDEKKILLFIQAMSIAAFSAHLFVLGSLASGAFLFLQIFRNFFFASDFSKRIDLIGLVLFISLFIGIYWFRMGVEPLSALPMLGSVLGTMACWSRSTKQVRWLFLLSTFPWTYYAILMNYHFVLVFELVMIVSLCINIIRFDVLRKTEN